MLSLLSLPEELHILILSKLDVRTTCKCALINKYFSKIVRGDKFWSYRNYLIFPPNVLKLKAPFYDFRQQFINLKLITIPLVAACQGYLDVLVYLETKKKMRITYKYLLSACKNGHLHIIQYYFGKIGFTYTLMETSMKHGHLEIAKWLNETMKFLPTIRGANLAAMNNHFDVLRWTKTFGVLPNSNGFNSAVIKGHLGIVKWLFKQEIKSKDPIWLALLHQQLHVANWLNNRGCIFSCDNNRLNILCKASKFDSIKWLVDKDYISGNWPIYFLLK